MTCQLEKRVFVPEETGPLDLLNRWKALVVADCQNLIESARRVGSRLRWKRLGDVLGPDCILHAVFAADGMDELQRRRGEYRRVGWTPHGRMSRVLYGERDADADDTLCCVLGNLMARFRFDALVIGTGDTRLAVHIAEFARHLVLPEKRCPVFTLNIPGSNGRQLDSFGNDLICQNIFIGEDCLVPR